MEKVKYSSSGSLYITEFEALLSKCVLTEDYLSITRLIYGKKRSKKFNLDDIQNINFVRGRDKVRDLGEIKIVMDANNIVTLKNVEQCKTVVDALRKACDNKRQNIH